VGFLQKLTAAGLRAVPMRESRMVRRVEPAAPVVPAPASHGAESRSRATDISNAVVTTEMVKPIASPPPAIASAAPSDDGRPVAAAGDQSPRIAPPPAHDAPVVRQQGGAGAPASSSPSMPPSPAERSVGEPEAPPPYVPPSMPLRRLPDLSSEAIDRSAGKGPLVDMMAPPPAPSPIDRPRLMDVEHVPAPPRVEPRRLVAGDTADRLLPLPTLEASMPEPPRPARSVADRPEQAMEAHERRERREPLDDRAPVERSLRTAVQPVPEGPRTSAPARPSATAAAGLTIHKLELQIVERPREVLPEPVVAAQPPAPAAWEWPDRRHHGFMW